MDIEKNTTYVCRLVRINDEEVDCTIVKRVDTFFKEKYLRTVA